MAWLVGLGLTASCVGTPVVIADENGEVHSWTSGSTVEKPTMATGARVYFVNDDPAYDLSGTRDHLFLLADGTAVRETREVVPVSAEYRQDWLAVAAGDRPVRTFTAPRTRNHDREEVMSTRRMSARNADTFRPVHHARRHHRVHYTGATHHRTYHRSRHAAMTVTHYAASKPAMTAESNMEIRRDEMGHELFQMGSSWYMNDNGDWFRSESWRGPFVRVRKGMVPREVRMSEKHPSRMDLDTDH